MPKMYSITKHASLACSANTVTGVGHPTDKQTLRLRRVGFANDSYVGTCECGSEILYLTYAKPKSKRR